MTTSLEPYERPHLQRLFEELIAEYSPGYVVDTMSDALAAKGAHHYANMLNDMLINRTRTQDRRNEDGEA